MKTPVLIVGAGPSGLALSALLKKQGTEHTIVEKGRVLGGTYAFIHPELKLLSPAKFLSLPLLDGGWKKDVVTAGEFKKYIHYYSEEFKIRPEYNKQLVKAEVVGPDVVSTFGDGKQIQSRSIVIATGKVNFPRPLPAAGNIPMEYAKDYRGEQHYAGKKVVIVGSGTSAVELATLLAPVANVTMVVKRNFKTMPLYIAGLNIHHVVHHFERFPKFLFNGICSGRQHEPAIDWGFTDKLKKGLIQMKLGTYSASGDKIQFSDGDRMQPDLIINATGYRYETSYLPNDVAKNEKGMMITKNNQSISHPSIYVMGQPCARKIDSAFIRGIRGDAVKLAHRLG